MMVSCLGEKLTLVAATGAQATYLFVQVGGVQRMVVWYERLGKDILIMHWLGQKLALLKLYSGQVGSDQIR